MASLQLASFPNGYDFVNGVEMHAGHGDRFQIVNPWFKKYLDSGDFVELRIDSTRFWTHEDAPAECECELCDEPATKPILCHDHPAALVPLPRQDVPSRGWGEQFWVRISDRQHDLLCGVIDNPLYESRLHGLSQCDEVTFHEDHILSVHAVHHREMLLRMDDDDFVAFGAWLEDEAERSETEES